MSRSVNGLMYILSTGCQWASLPKDLPPRSTVNDYFCRWDYDGTLDCIHHALYVTCRERAGRDASPTAAIIDSQSVKSAEKGGFRSTRPALMREEDQRSSKRHVSSSCASAPSAANRRSSIGRHPRPRSGGVIAERAIGSLPLRAPPGTSCMPASPGSGSTSQTRLQRRRACSKVRVAASSRLRRGELGPAPSHRRTVPRSLRPGRGLARRPANRVSNGAQAHGVVRLAMRCQPSVDFCGYWQRAHAA